MAASSASEKKLPPPLNSFAVLLCNNPRLLWFAGSALFLLLLLLLVFPLLHSLLLFFTPLLLSTSLCIFAIFTINPYLAATGAEVEREARLCSAASFHSHADAAAGRRSAQPGDRIQAPSPSPSPSPSSSSVSAWFNPSDWFCPPPSPSSSPSAKSWYASSVSASAPPSSSSSGYGRNPGGPMGAPARAPAHHLRPPPPLVAASAPAPAPAPPPPPPVTARASMEAPISRTWGSWMEGLNDSGKEWLQKKLAEEGRSLSEPADRETLVALLQGSFAELVHGSEAAGSSQHQKLLRSKVSQIEEEGEAEKERCGAMAMAMAVSLEQEKTEPTELRSDGGEEEAAAEVGKGSKIGAETAMELNAIAVSSSSSSSSSAAASAERSGSTEKVLEASRRIIDAVKVLGASSEKHRSSILSRFRHSSSSSSSASASASASSSASSFSAKLRREAMAPSPAGAKATRAGESPADSVPDTKTTTSSMPSPSPLPSSSSSSSSSSSAASASASASSSSPSPSPSLADLLVASPGASSTAPSSSSSSSLSCPPFMGSSSTTTTSSAAAAASLPSSTSSPAIPTKLPRKFLEEPCAKPHLEVPAIAFGPVPAIAAEDKKDSAKSDAAVAAEADLGPKFDDDHDAGDANRRSDLKGDDDDADDGLEVEEAQALVRSEFKMLEMEIEEVASKLPKLDEFLNTYQKAQNHQPSSVRTPSKLLNHNNHHHHHHHHHRQTDASSSFASTSSLARSVRSLK